MKEAENDDEGGEEEEEEEEEEFVPEWCPWRAESSGEQLKMKNNNDNTSKDSEIKGRINWGSKYKRIIKITLKITLKFN